MGIGKPLRYASTVGVGYAAVAGLYIAVSSRWAADAALSVEELARWETTKGFLYVLVTAGLLFVGTWALFRRLQERERLLARSREVVRIAEMRATPGLLASSLAHDLRNILSVARIAVEEIRAGEITPEVLDDLEASVERAVELTHRFTQMGRSATGRVDEATVASIVEPTLELLRLLPEARHRDVKVELREDAPRRLRRQLVEQAFTNLFLNAMDATQRGGRLLVRVRVVEETSVLEVHDDGPGFPEGFVAEAFLTSKESGTGLGLVSVRACAEAHGGRLELERSTVLGGACARVRFVAARGESSTSKDSGEA